MSAIDVHAHEICGTLAGVAVYHPLEDFGTGWDYPLGPHQLMVGGGSGEHPEAVFDILTAVYLFLLDDELEETSDVPGFATRLFEFPTERIERILQVLDKAVLEREDAFSFNWSGDVWHGFVERAMREEGYGRPYVKSVDGSIENWVISSIGEYALVSMRDLVVSLAPSELSEELVALSTAVAQRPLYMNVMAFPSGYEYVGGRRERIADGNVRH